MKQICYRHWNLFRHVFKIYHRLRGVNNEESYYAADGGFNLYYDSSTKYLDCDDFLSSLRQFAAEFYNNHLFYMDLYNSLADDKSKNVLFHVIKGRLTLNPAEYHEVADSPEMQYFDPEIISFHEEVFCDVGAYIGDTVKILIDKYGDYTRRIYLYEPNNKNCCEAKKVIDAHRNLQTDVVIRKCGVSDKPQKAYISDSSSGSQVNDTGNGEEITLITLDDDITEKITFIKMDIEGSELSALRGGQQHILRDKPKMAICVYHKVEDIRNIFQWIKAQVPEYRFYIRHYSNRFSETVLYCII